MARYAPGLSAPVLRTFTPEETRYMRKQIAADVRGDRELTAALHGHKLQGG